jgi:hypothetical protein
VPEHQRNIRSLLGGLFSLPGNIDWWWHIGFPGVGSLVTAIVAYWQAEPFLFGLLSVIAIYVGLFVVGIPLRRRWQHADSDSSSGDSSPTVRVTRVEGNMIVQQSPTPSTKPEPEVSPDRYHVDDTINITDLPREIMLGNEVIRDRTFKNCRILGPAVLFVQEPKRPMTFIGCEWTEGNQAFSVMPPDDYPDDVTLIRLYHCIFWGCRFTQVEMAVSQETYDRYERGETGL